MARAVKSKQAKEMRSEKWVSSACRCRNEAPSFSLLTSLRPSRRVLKSKLLMDCCALCPTAARQTIIMASLSALMETEKVLPQLRLPSSLIINLESFWHRRERVELPSPHREFCKVSSALIRQLNKVYNCWRAAAVVANEDINSISFH